MRSAQGTANYTPTLCRALQLQPDIITTAHRRRDVTVVGGSCCRSRSRWLAAWLAAFTPSRSSLEAATIFYRRNQLFRTTRERRGLESGGRLVLASPPLRSLLVRTRHSDPSLCLCGVRRRRTLSAHTTGGSRTAIMYPGFSPMPITIFAFSISEINLHIDLLSGQRTARIHHIYVLLLLMSVGL